MGTTTSFFGGGSGGGTVLNAPNQGFVNNIDFAANTQFAMPAGDTSVRGWGPRVIPCKSNTFFLVEGYPSSGNLHVSYWSLDDSGAATQEASAIQIDSTATQLRGAASNGVDRLMLYVQGGTTAYLRHIYYNGSVLSTSQLTSLASARHSPSTVTCTADGDLLGVLTSGSSTSSHKCYAIKPDGTTITSTVSSHMQGGNNGRLIGTGEGIIGCGKKSNQNTYFTSVKIYINSANNATLSTIAVAQNSVNVQSAYFQNNDRPPYVLPTKGGAYAAYIDGSSFLQEFSLSSFGRQINILPRAIKTTPMQLHSGNTDLLLRTLGTDSTFCRQSNGTYMNFIGSAFSHYVTFDPVNYSHHAPFGTIRPVGDGNSSGCSEHPSTAIVGKFVLSTWYDSTDGDVNIDAWNYRG